ncbi:Ankyrin repeat domain-containing protein 39 [Papilio xuthus]|uniref:Ankyrin repeat domain-containing protein 39 n=1 Tax=Papilio xuthus TaxID=66420 RepID=A0A194PKF5_PAPXU|nr:Ankyrin repeat domain-containing protein 39 [Papilio xuthus]
MDHHNTECNHANCSVKNTNNSVCQTISEMDWERGLWNAAFSGDEEKVSMLINKAREAREIVNTVDNAGYSPLHYAARGGHVNICDILLRNGAIIDAETRSGKATPLHKAAAAGKITTVQFLIKNGARVDKQDIDGQTALHKAIQNKRYDLIKTLTDACPHINNIRDNKGNLPDPSLC